MNLPPWMWSLLSWIGGREWDTLIAGVLALAGAWLTVRAVQRQIAQADAHAERRRREQERAARAALVFGLSAIVEYALDCMRTANQLPLSYTAGSLFPPLPAGIIEPLRNCIIYADETDAARIAALLEGLQVQQSRGFAAGAFRAVIDAGRLVQLAEELFAYARGPESDRTLPPPLSELHPILLRAGLKHSRHPDVQAVLQQSLSDRTTA